MRRRASTDLRGDRVEVEIGAFEEALASAQHVVLSLGSQGAARPGEMPLQASNACPHAMRNGGEACSRRRHLERRLHAAHDLWQIKERGANRLELIAYVGRADRIVGPHGIIEERDRMTRVEELKHARDRRVCEAASMEHRLLRDVRRPVVAALLQVREEAIEREEVDGLDRAHVDE